MEADDRDLGSIVRSLLKPPLLDLLGDNEQEFVRFIAERMHAGEPLTQAQRLALFDVVNATVPGYDPEANDTDTDEDVFDPEDFEIQDDRHLDSPEDYWDQDEDDE